MGAVPDTGAAPVICIVLDPARSQVRAPPHTGTTSMQKTILVPPVTVGALERVAPMACHYPRRRERRSSKACCARRSKRARPLPASSPSPANAKASCRSARIGRASAAQPVQAMLGLDGLPADGARFTLATDAWAVELGADGTACVRVIRPGRRRTGCGALYGRSRCRLGQPAGRYEATAYCALPRTITAPAKATRHGVHARPACGRRRPLAAMADLANCLIPWA